MIVLLYLFVSLCFAQIYLPALPLGPLCHSGLQSVHLGHDEADMFPQRIRALVQLHLLPDPRVLVPVRGDTSSLVIIRLQKPRLLAEAVKL